MYTLRLLLATLLTALMSLRCSSDLRHLLICGTREQRTALQGSNKARLGLLHVAADLKVLRPYAWSRGAADVSTAHVNPTAEAGDAAPIFPDAWMSWKTSTSSCDRPLNLAR